MSSPICELPNEVLLAIVAHLDLAAVLAFRQTSRIICEATAAKLVWLRFLEEQQASMPLYASIRDTTSAHVLGLSAEVLRSMVLQNHRIDCLWLVRRGTVPKLIRSPLNEHLIGVELLEDRWLLAVYAEGIHLWDLDADDVESSLLLQREGLTSYYAMYDAANERILIAVKKHSFISPFVTVLYQVSTLRPHDFVLICNIRTHSMHVPRFIDPTCNIVASAHACLVELLDWTDPERTAVQVPTEGEELEEMYTAINAIRLFGPYMVIFKTRSIELHPLPAQFQSAPYSTIENESHLGADALPVVKHTFSNTYRNYAMSGPDNLGLPSTTFSLFASDLIQGLFHYTIHISLHANDIPTLRVTLNGVHSLSNLLYRQNPAYDPTMQGTTYHQRSSVASYSRKSTVSDSGGPNKGFVSAYSLGTQGMRAVWMQRSRENMLREVVAARLHSEDSITELEEAYDVPDIEAKVVRDMRSVDLKEDLTHCALGEASGRIVLGNRAGEVYLLDINLE